MAKFSHAQTDFGSGEIGEKLSGRIEMNEYRRGLKEMRGFYPSPTGGAVYCPGARRISRNYGTTLHKYYDTATGNDLILSLDGTAGAFDLDLSDFNGNTLFVDSAAVKTELNGLNIELEKNQFSFGQIGEILFIVHNSGLLEPLVLSKENNVFVLRFYDESPNRLDLHPSLSYPFDDKNIGTINVTSTGTLLNSSLPLFSADDVGTWFRLETSSTTEGVFKINNFISPIQVGYTEFQLSTGYAHGAASTKWAKSTWSQARGWPKIVTLMDGHTIFSNNRVAPTATWVSNLNNYFLITAERYAADMTSDNFVNYFGGIQDTDAFVFRLSSGDAREIRWLSAQRSLHIGTDEGEYVVVEGSGKLGALLDFGIRQQTAHGSSFVNSAKADKASIFVSRDGTRIRNFTYSEENGAYLSSDLSLLSEDIIRHLYDKDQDRYSDIKISKTLWDRDRFLLWVLTTSGALVGLAIIPTSNTVGWFARPIGGNGLVESISEITDPSSQKTHIVLAVDRNGEKSIERIGPAWESDRIPPLPQATLPWIPNADHLPFYLDKSTREAGDPLALNQFDASNYLLGEEITTLEFKGAVYKVGKYTVVDDGFGNRILDIADEPDYVIMGYPYEGTIKSLNIEAGSIIGNAQPLVKSIEKLFIRLYKTLGGQFGSSESNLKPIKYKSVVANCAYTGDVEVLFPSDPGEQHQYIIKQNEPLPMHLVAVFMRGRTED
jgi:hypothetical protein